MERKDFFTRLGAGILVFCSAIPLMANKLNVKMKNSEEDKLNAGEIQHMVIFDLRHAKGSELAEKFLGDGKQILSKIPGVRNFQVFNQVSLKNDYNYGFSMVFDNKFSYDSYNNHANHLSFVENRWKKEVSRFLEIDFKSH